MGIKWKNRAKRWMAKALLLGGMLIVPGTVSFAEVPQKENIRTEMCQEGLPGENQPKSGLAEEELPGVAGNDEEGVMPCGDLEEEKNVVDA